MTDSDDTAILAGDEMDDRDRNLSSGSSRRDSRRRSEDDDASGVPPARRRPRQDDQEPAARSRSDEQPYRRDPISQTGRESGRYRPPSRDEEPARSQSSDRFRRAGRESANDIDDRSPSSTRDPYDRLRRVGNRPARRVDPDFYDDHTFDDFDDRDPELGLPGRRRIGFPGTRPPTPGLRARQVSLVGARLSNPAPELRPIVLGAVVALGSLVLLAIVLLIRGGDLQSWFPTRLNAEGDATVFGTPRTVWRLPVFMLFSTIMALGLGWWLREREPFAAQFLAVGALLIHGLIWVSAITLLW